MTKNTCQTKEHNLSAGPSILPYEVIEETTKAISDFNGSGLSVLEISRQGKDLQAVTDEAVALFKKIPNTPGGYPVSFLGGGASMRFCMVPYNFSERKVVYLSTGVQAKKATKEARGFGEAAEVASLADANYMFIPKDFTIPADADYLHVTTDNTTYDTELKGDLDSPIPTVVDMSSDIFSCPIGILKYICIYGDAQESLALSSATSVIIKGDAVGRVSRYIPSMLNYKTHIDDRFISNTPPVLPIHSAMQTLRWIKAQGDVKEIDRRATGKVDILHAEIDRNKMFVGTVARGGRSRMSICFVVTSEYKDLEADFLKFATDKGMPGIKGHRPAGGFRVSRYNVMPKEGVQALIDCMQEFEKLHQ